MEPIKRLWPIPKNLSGYALDFYRRVGRQLIDHRILTELDRESFLSLCAAYHIQMAALDGINEAGATVVGRGEEIKKNPSLTMYKTASDIFNRLSKRFYLCPADREGVEIRKPENQEDGKKRYFI